MLIPSPPLAGLVKDVGQPLPSRPPLAAAPGSRARRAFVTSNRMRTSGPKPKSLRFMLSVPVVYTCSARAMVLRPLLLATWTCACLVTARGATVQFIALDADTGKPLPCRVHVKDATGKPVRPQGLPFWHDHFVCAGSADLDLVFGTYTYEIDRGPEYALTTGTVAIAEATHALTNRLRRLVN